MLEMALPFHRIVRLAPGPLLRFLQHLDGDGIIAQMADKDI